MLRRSIIALCLFLAASAPAAPKAGGASKMSEGEAKFAAQLYTRLAAQPGNLFLSPTSIRLALGMAYAGAKGPTAEEMRTTLALPEGAAAHEGYAAQLKRWAGFAHPQLPASATESNDPGMQKYWEEELARRTVVLHVVNRLWTQRGAHLRADYLARLKDSYQATAVDLDFAKAPEPSRLEINRWVSEQTQKKIPELIPPRVITKDTRSVLTNAIYFKAAWQSEFTPGSTQVAPFHVTATEQVRVPLMHQTEHFSLGQFPGGSILELPYGGGKLAMDILLPTAKDGLPALEKQLAQGALTGWFASLQGQRVEVLLPRFKIAASFNLGETLKAMGMALAFTFPGADFSGVDDTHLLYLSAVVHQAVVEVDEHGTEAAAATAAEMAAGGMPSKPVVFRADHPFIFLIRDLETGAILFLGRLKNPASK